MAFPDPFSITINAVAVPLNKTGAATASAPSTFSSADGLYKLAVNHTYGKRVRRVARLDFRKLAPDVLQPATTTPYTMACYLVVDVPIYGWSIAEQKSGCAGLIDMFNRTSGSDLQKLLEGQT